MKTYPNKVICCLDKFLYTTMSASQYHDDGGSVIQGAHLLSLFSSLSHISTEMLILLFKIWQTKFSILEFLSYKFIVEHSFL